MVGRQRHCAGKLEKKVQYKQLSKRVAPAGIQITKRQTHFEANFIDTQNNSADRYSRLIKTQPQTLASTRGGLGRDEKEGKGPAFPPIGERTFGEKQPKFPRG